LHGAVRLQGLTSSPTPETQVRVAWALAGADAMNGTKPATKASKAIRRISTSLCALRTSQPLQKTVTIGLQLGRDTIKANAAESLGY
jgi:hypothetical protein